MITGRIRVFFCAHVVQIVFVQQFCGCGSVGSHLSNLQCLHTHTHTSRLSVCVCVLTSTESGSQHRFHCTDKPIDDMFAFFFILSFSFACFVFVRAAFHSHCARCWPIFGHQWNTVHTVQRQRQRQKRQHWLVLSKSFASCRLLAGAKALAVCALSKALQLEVCTVCECRQSSLFAEFCRTVSWMRCCKGSVSWTNIL